MGNGNAGCFLSWQGRQNILSNLTDPSLLVDTKEGNRSTATCPKQECHNNVDG